MNKRGIDFTPSFLFGLILGIAFLMIGLLALKQCTMAAYGEVKQTIFDELNQKISELEDGEETSVQYRVKYLKEVPNNQKNVLNAILITIVGFDKGQDSNAAA